MQNARGMILLPDPLSENRRFGSMASQMQREIENTETLIFNEDGRFLPQLRAALYRMRGVCRQVGIAAEGFMAGAAVSVAAQLPVDEIVLFESRIFASARREMRAAKQLARINAFARRNLSFVVSDAILVDCDAAEVRQLTRFLVNGSIRIVHSASGTVENLWRKDEQCESKDRSRLKTPASHPK